MIEYRDEIQEILSAISGSSTKAQENYELETELDRILSKVADNAYNCGLGLTSCD